MISDEELKQCAEIEYNCWKENFAPMLHISEYLYYQTRTSIKNEIKTLLKKKDSHIILAYDSKFEVVNRIRQEVRTLSGFAIVRTHPSGRDEYLIEKFFISPKHQNRRIGQSLLETIIANFSNKSIVISVFEQNRIAQHILLKNNFRFTMPRKSKLTYGKNEISIQNVYYKLDKVEEK